MIRIENIKKPRLLIDEKKCISNIKGMIKKTNDLGIKLRPHFKTHQSPIIGEWLRERGITAITVSSLSMAKEFSGYGWEDITVAFPVNLREKLLIENIAKKTDLKLTVESANSIKKLAGSIRYPVSIMVKIDCGYNRAGIPADDFSGIKRVVNEINKSDMLTLRGFLTHAGHSYYARSSSEIIEIHDESRKRFIKAVEKYKKSDPDLVISYGDTPTSVICNNFTGIDELRPGNFVFFDLKQWSLGVCSFDEIAVAVAAPVVSLHPDRNEVVVYAGSVHLSKDMIAGKNGENVYGIPVMFNSAGWGNPDDGSYVSALSQEHGIIKCTPGLVSKISEGMLLGILPVHSCLTADLFDSYITTGGRELKRIDTKN